MEADEPDLAALAAHAVRNAGRIPDAHRQFTQTAAGARIQGIPGDLLDVLLDLGFPHRGTGPRRRFDALDLENASLALRRGPRWTAMRWWPRSLRDCGHTDQMEFRLAVTAACPAPASVHPCGLEAHPDALVAADPTSVRPLPNGFTLRLVTASVGYEFGPPFRALAERVLSVEYHLLPEALSDDLGFVMDTDLADCRLAAKHIVHTGHAMGLPVRPAQGLLLARPYPGWHTWVEFHTGTGWLAADPFLLGNLHRWGLLSDTEWPAHRSPAGILCRWEDDRRPLITHGGARVHPVLALSRESSPPPVSH